MSNPYLEGNFGPVHDEVTLTDLRVTGTIPERADRSLPAQRAEPGDAAGSRRLPLVRRRRHGPRPAPRRRSGRVVPEPLGAQRHGRRRAGRGAPRRTRPQRHGLRAQHQRHRPPRHDAGHRRGGGPALRARLRARHDRVDRPRRRARRRLHRAPEGRSGHGRAPRRVLLLGLGQPGAVHRGRHGREGRDEAHGRDDRQPDAARHVAHRALRRRLRPARRVRPRRGDGRRSAAVLLEGRLPGPARADRPDRRGRPRALARRRPLLRLPPA